MTSVISEQKPVRQEALEQLETEAVTVAENQAENAIEQASKPVREQEAAVLATENLNLENLKPVDIKLAAQTAEAATIEIPQAIESAALGITTHHEQTETQQFAQSAGSSNIPLIVVGSHTTVTVSDNLKAPKTTLMATGRIGDVGEVGTTPIAEANDLSALTMNRGKLKEAMPEYKKKENHSWSVAANIPIIGPIIVECADFFARL